MKKISKILVVFLMILSLTLLVSCGDKDKDDDSGKNNPPEFVIPGGNLTEDGVETEIIPYP